MTYEAGVFFGVAFARDSTEGKRLAAHIDRYSGTPAPTSEAEVEIDHFGCHPTGETWLTVQVKGSVQSFMREDPMVAPALLEEGPRWADAIERFLAAEGIRTAPAIGWRFYGNVS